jgi:hypothetical protein
MKLSTTFAVCLLGAASATSLRGRGLQQASGFVYVGEGKCTIDHGNDPAGAMNQFFSNTPPIECRQHCAQNNLCSGYSPSVSGTNCLIWLTGMKDLDTTIENPDGDWHCYRSSTSSVATTLFSLGPFVQLGERVDSPELPADLCWQFDKSGSWVELPLASSMPLFSIYPGRAFFQPGNGGLADLHADEGMVLSDCTARSKGRSCSATVVGTADFCGSCEELGIHSCTALGTRHRGGKRRTHHLLNASKNAKRTLCAQATRQVIPTIA